jgi:hypothetical protein
MADHRFTTTFAADPTPVESPGAVTCFRGWRPQHTGGSTAQPGFTQCHQNVRRCRTRVTQPVPGRKVSWSAADSYFNFTEDETISA